MHKNLGATLLAFGVLALQPSFADTIFNVRANLNDRIYIRGTETIDTTTGVVTGANISALYDGGTVALLGTVAGQEIFAPGGGIAPAYLVNITGSSYSAPYLLNVATPATSLVNYQGFLAPASDAISNFNLAATFDNGDHMLGIVSIDTTRGLVLDEFASLYSGATLVTTFNNPDDDHPYLPTDGSDPFYQIQSRNSGGYLFNLGLTTTSLVNYTGGNICGTSNDTNCDFSDFYTAAGLLGEVGIVTSGTLSLPASTPEPASLFLVTGALMGLLTLRLVRRQSARASNAQNGCDGKTCDS